MAELVVKNPYPKDTCHDEIGPHVHNVDTIFGSVVYITWNAYVIAWTHKENLGSL